MQVGRGRHDPHSSFRNRGLLVDLEAGDYNGNKEGCEIFVPLSAGRLQKPKGAVMPEIVVTEEQAQLIRDARSPVQVRDAKGRVLGVISQPSRADDSDMVEEIKRRMQKPHRCYSTGEVLDYLRSLESK